MALCGVDMEKALEVKAMAKLKNKVSSSLIDNEEETSGGYRSYISTKRVWYDEDLDVYVTYLPGVPHAVELPGQVHRDLIRAYSNYDDSPVTVSELARMFKLPKTWLAKYLRVHQITHDVEPFSKEEILSRSDDELIEEAFQLRRASLCAKMEKEKWGNLKKDAAKWRDLEVSILEHFTSVIEKRGAPEHVEKFEMVSDSDREFIAVIGLTDLHYGKYASKDETGEAFSKDICKRRLFSCTQEVLSRVLHFGVPEMFVVPVGSDFFHIDNYAGSTTRGTPQDIDGTPSDLLVEGCRLMEMWIEFLRRISKVKLILMVGNHDRMLGLSLLLYLDALYRNADDVTVCRDRTPRTYITYGKNLIGFAHGDGVKKTSDLSALMANEASAHWGNCPHKVIYTGHLHSEKVEVDSFFGVSRRQLPCLSGTDRWHSAQGYVGQTKSLPVFVHDKEEGLIAVAYGYNTRSDS
jgi:hypothetical protein